MAALRKRGSVCRARRPFRPPGGRPTPQPRSGRTRRPVEARFRQLQDADVILTLPGMGPITDAEFIAAADGDLAAFASPDRLAGLAPVPLGLRESQRQPAQAPPLPPRPATRPLPPRSSQRVLLSRLEGVPRPEEEEGKGHKQAVLTLARRRVNVLWAMIRYHTPFQTAPTLTQAAWQSALGSCLLRILESTAPLERVCREENARSQAKEA
ncbi:transposase [Streptomyces sp. CAS3]